MGSIQTHYECLIEIIQPPPSKPEPTITPVLIITNKSPLEVTKDEKNRLVWTEELHSRFLTSLGTLGERATPRQIMMHMRVLGLERHHISSHLQKYRNKQKKSRKTFCKKQPF